MTPSQEPADIKWLDITESTNKCLRDAPEAYDNLSVVAALEQTAGRGQGTHTWHSLPGRNLTFSILFKPRELPAANIILITCATTLGLLDYLRDEGVRARIKWPNDIWVEDKKICGILIENALNADKVQRSIIGIGFNLNQCEWPDDLPNPVSLKQLTGKEYELKTEMEELAKKIRRRLTVIGSITGEKDLQEEFGKYLFRLPSEHA